MSEQAEASKKAPMTDEERLALCQKMDQELDEFINSLERKRYSEGWPEDRWEEEMDKHPFFMKQTPEGGELPPLAEGLAKLKYDPNENSPVELATNYKEDGNFNFKHKNYRLALLGYTEGIKVRCGDAETEASLYNNRAAAHYHLKNYRSSLLDCEKALTFKPDHIKARLRAAKCALEIGRFETSIAHCEELLKTTPDNKEASDLLKIVTKKKQLSERDDRKKQKVALNKEEEKYAVIKAILERGIRVSQCEDADDLDLAKLEPCLPGAHESMVHLDNGVLKWPVLLLYPELQTTDFIKACPENVPLTSQLEQLFPAPWDEKDKYKVSKINLYFEGYDQMPHVVDVTKTLGEILKLKYFELKAGTPSFFVLPKGSKVEKGYLQSYI